MKVILNSTSSELIEKKSRFIGNVFYIDSVEKAEEKISEIKKKYYDARHTCYAYVIGENKQYMKSSDDGEPSGTAGHPMIDILKGRDIINVLATVTRYFGGTLLGTGGLVRCYSESLKIALDKNKFSDINYGHIVEFNIGYDEYGKLEKYVNDINEKNEDIIVIEKDFLENIHIKYLIKENFYDTFYKFIINLTKGKCDINSTDKKTFFINENKKIIYV